MSTADQLTSLEVRLAEQYVSVLDFTSRCAQAVEGGNWYYLADKAAQLHHATGHLVEIASEAERATRQPTRRTPRPRPLAVCAAFAHYGRHYRAGRLLHPLEPHPQGGERR
jgi:hypothetical protein